MFLLDLPKKCNRLENNYREIDLKKKVLSLENMIILKSLKESLEQNYFT